MDKTTFGKIKATIELVKILEKYEKKDTNKVGRVLEGLGRAFNYIKEKDIPLFLVEPWKNRMIERTEIFPDEIKRFMKNIIIGQYRKFLNQRRKKI